MIKAKQPVNTANPLPPISFINKAIKISVEALNKAGNNLTKNTSCPKIFFTINARKDINGGVDANPHDK
jgi:hypothetical protein